MLTGLLLAGLLLLLSAPAEARTVYRCERDGSVSLSTAPEPGSSCQGVEIDDHSAMPYARSGIWKGTLYRRTVGGRVVYGTRRLPGAVAVQKFDFTKRRRARRPSLGKPRLQPYKAVFRSAAQKTGTDEAWLRAIAHVESAYRAKAVSPKGAMGIMQLMPATARHYKVVDAFDAAQSIHAGARHLRMLRDLYSGDRVRVAAAYNAGTGAVKRYRGVPPYAETRAYVRKVMHMYARYRVAMGRYTRTATTPVVRPLMDTLRERACQRDPKRSAVECTTAFGGN
ncbi:MAG: lytic transglycosylase domain-containing protein [Pseudomonadota bacterium]